MISKFNPVYNSEAEYRLITLDEYLEDGFARMHWCSPNAYENMNFLFGVTITKKLAESIYKNNSAKGTCYNLNPKNSHANNKVWTIYKEFLRKKETKPLVSIPSIL